MNRVSRFIDRLENVFFASFVCFLILLFVGWLIPSIWAYLFSAIVSFVITDAILNGLIHIGESPKKISSKSDFERKGHDYVIFLVEIIFSTVLSSLFAEGLYQTYVKDVSWWLGVLMTDTIASILVFVDLLARFYD